MARELVGVGALPFDPGGQPLRRRALAGLILAVALPVPLVSASGLSLPLPGFVERMAVALAAGVTSNGSARSTSSSHGLRIARTAAERAQATRAAVAPPSAPAVSRTVVHRSVPRKPSVPVLPRRRSEHVVVPTQRDVLAAVAPAPAVVAPVTAAAEVTTRSVPHTVDRAPTTTPPVTVSTDARIVDPAADPVPVVPIVPVVTVDPVTVGPVTVGPVTVGPVTVGPVTVVPVVPVVTLGPGTSGSSHGGGNSGSGSSGHGNGGSDDSSGNSGKGKSGSG
jgi:hypothetical protein